MVKFSDLDIPVIFKKQLLFKSGDWNRWHISPDEVNRSPSNTRWSKFNRSLIYSHKDKEAEAWVGNVQNIQAEGGKVYGDLHVYDPSTAIALKHGEAPFAISAGIAWPDVYDQPKDFFYRNFSLVADPGVRDKEIFVNFKAEDNPINGYKIASFANEINSGTSEGSPVDGHMNNAIVGGKKKKIRMCKMCKANYEDEEDEVEMPKKEFVEEHKNLVEVLKSGSKEEQLKEAKDQASELKEYDMANYSKETKEHEAKESKEKEKGEQEEGDTEEKEADMAKEKVQESPKQEAIEEASKKANMMEDRIDDSHGTQAMKEDVIKKKEWTMENMESKIAETPLNKENPNEENKVNYDNKNERRLQEKSPMETEKKVPNVEERISAIEEKISSFKKKEANFEEAKTETPKETKEVPKDLTQTPKQESASYTNATPVMDDQFVDKVVSKLSEKISALKPAPMTTQEFGGQVQNSQEDAVERLAKKLVRN